MLPTRALNRRPGIVNESTGMPGRLPKINRKLIAETGIIPAGYQLIKDSYVFDVIDKKNAIREDRNGGETPVMVVRGLIQNGNVGNANGRYYSTKDVLVPAVENIQDDVSNRAVLGECDHPTDAKIHLDRISHLMTKIWMEGNKVFGEAEILHKVPYGALVRGLFEHKVRVGISSRGVGDMEVMESNGQELYNVLPGYAFVTWDIVAEPSVSGAILNIHEGLVRKLRPLHEGRAKKLFTPDKYNSMLVGEINEFFGLR